MTIDYFLANQEDFPMIPYSNSTGLIFLVIGILILVNGLFLVKAFKHERGFRRIGTILLSSFFIFILMGIFVPTAIHQKDLYWSMNETYLILYNEATPEIEGIWEWGNLNVVLFKYYDSDDNCVYKIKFTDEKDEVVAVFESSSLSSLAKQIYPFSTYFPDFSKQIQENSLLKTDETNQFLTALNKLIEETSH